MIPTMRHVFVGDAVGGRVFFGDGGCRLFLDGGHRIQAVE